METIQRDIRYYQAKNRVRQIRRFYVHLAIFLIVNVISNYSDFNQPKNWNFENKWGLYLWTLALINHGLTVFVPGFLFGKNWEERKIREIIEKNR